MAASPALRQATVNQDTMTEGLRGNHWLSTAVRLVVMRLGIGRRDASSVANASKSNRSAVAFDLDRTSWSGFVNVQYSPKSIARAIAGDMIILESIYEQKRSEKIERSLRMDLAVFAGSLQTATAQLSW